MSEAPKHIGLETNWLGQWALWNKHESVSSVVVSYTRTDLSQASVAAALEAAAELCDREHAGAYWGRAIRAMITPDQRTALAAHVTAEVAKARAEDDWQPIGTVPKDGTKVDLWCLTYGNGIRIIDMWWTGRGGWRDGKNDFFNADAAKSATHWRKPAKSPSQIGAKP